MTGERFEVDGLAAVRWGAGAPRYVLLHAGVADSRSWEAVAPALDGPAVAYDRRGFGATPPGPDGFRHLDDLLAVLDAVASEPVWLIGNSMGGALAIDAALEAPERFAGLVLIGPGVSSEVAGFEMPPTTPAEQRWEAAWEAAGEDDVEERLRLDAWLWLDGPEHEGRVGGAARELAIDMDRRVFAHGAPDEAGFNGVDGGGRLGELRDAGHGRVGRVRELRAGGDLRGAGGADPGRAARRAAGDGAPAGARRAGRAGRGDPRGARGGTNTGWVGERAGRSCAKRRLPPPAADDLDVDASGRHATSGAARSGSASRP